MNNKKKSRPTLDSRDKSILRAMLKNKGWLNTNEIKTKASVNWATAKRKLTKFSDLGYVKKRKKGKLSYFKVD